jgi:hypothetical protein
MSSLHRPRRSRVRPALRPPLRALEALEAKETPTTTVATIATGAEAGAAPQVRVYDAAGGLRFDVLAYDPQFTGGVRVATGDVTGDGIDDVITAPGANGGPHIKVIDGQSGALVGEFNAYDPRFIGGVYVAAGDVTGDGRADIITGAGAGGGPHVRVFDLATNQVVASFFAYNPAFRGGVSVAAGDTDGDGRADIITGAGPGGGPHVQSFSGKTLQRVHSFFAYNPAFRGGVFVAAGDTTGDGRADIITGAGPGGGPNVAVYNGTDAALLRSFFAFPASFAGGVRVGAADLNYDGRDDLVAGPGPTGDPQVRAFDVASLAPLATFTAFGAAGTGLFVG